MSKPDKPGSRRGKISRRDFIQGVAVAAGGSLPLAGCMVAGQGDGTDAAARFRPHPADYPPAATGLRGSHDGSFEVAHALRDGARYESARDSGEHYDLVVVGGGISGLSAAWFYRQQRGEDARILVIENHDDFGGHARRNEFTVNGKTLLGYGGSESIDTPSSYSEVASQLLIDLGIDVQRFYRDFDQDFYQRLGMGSGDFFNAEQYGRDQLLARGGQSWPEYVAQFPLPDDARQALAELEDAPRSELQELDPDARRGRLRQISYQAYLSDVLGMPEGVARYLADKPRDYFGIGADGLSALSAFEAGFPGFTGVFEADESLVEEPYIFHFPDGNATIARALVSRLIPGSTEARNIDELVSATFDYERLDRADRSTRLRLNSTVVNVNERDGRVEVVYVRGGEPIRVSAEHAVLACWNTMVPYLCPQLPQSQRQALSHSVKVPLLYAHVAVNDFRPWQRLGVHQVYCPGAFFSDVTLNFPVSLGGYRFARSADDPVMIHMIRSPAMAGLPPGPAFRAGRAQVLGTPFEFYERQIIEQLSRMFGPAGFDAERDIAAITLNRWPHGYAWEYAYAGEADWADDERPNVIGRRPFGRIGIANSDSAGLAYADAAIDEAHRAISELLRLEA